MVQECHSVWSLEKQNFTVGYLWRVTQGLGHARRVLQPPSNNSSSKLKLSKKLFSDQMRAGEKVKWVRALDAN